MEVSMEDFKSTNGIGRANKFIRVFIVIRKSGSLYNPIVLAESGKVKDIEYTIGSERYTDSSENFMSSK
jgi:hypothetical protein